jgi:hypothetical protein
MRSVLPEDVAAISVRNSMVEAGANILEILAICREATTRFCGLDSLAFISFEGCLVRCCWLGTCSGQLLKLEVELRIAESFPPAWSGRVSLL